MSYAIGIRERVAKRRWKRPCGLCPDRIQPGERVVTYIIRDAGDFYACVEHHSCREIRLRCWDHFDEEWFPLEDRDLDDARAMRLKERHVAKGAA